jgi:hypothetical protein
LPSLIAGAAAGIAAKMGAQRPTATADPPTGRCRCSSQMSPSKMNAMVDDKTKRAPQDTKLISLTEDYEIDYWTEKFGVSPRKFGVTPRKVSPRLCAGSGTPPRRWKSTSNEPADHATAAVRVPTAT